MPPDTDVRLATPPCELVRVQPVMGTVLSLRVADDPGRGPGGVAPLLDRTLAGLTVWLEHVEAVFSTYRPGSQISRLGRGELTLDDCDPAVVEVMHACAWLTASSDGAFRPRRPDWTLDPSGFVKGWAVQQVSDELARAGLTDHLVGIGGDLMARGRRSDGGAWQVGIADPADHARIVTSVALSDGAVATSGRSERGDHLWDGRGHTVSQPDATSPFASISVLGPSITWADAFATTAWAMGAAGPGWVAGFDGYDTLTVDHSGTVTRWSGQLT